ncbi:hypothetical protein SOVF_030560 [Spinacia oleracea]|nr:hypothetical protein SOVF_030560 [Spinacia oleracea]
MVIAARRNKKEGGKGGRARQGSDAREGWFSGWFWAANRRGLGRRLGDDGGWFCGGGISKGKGGGASRKHGSAGGWA